MTGKPGEDSRVVFVVDSGYDLPDLELPFKPEVLPLRVYLGEKEYNDKVDIRSDEIYEAQRSGQMATTSLPAPEIAERMLRKLSEQFERVFLLTISSKLSNTYSVLKGMVETLKLRKVEVLDSKAASVKQGYVLWRAMRHFESTGRLTQEDIDGFAKDVLLVFFVSTLEYLYKGGRIGKAKALLGKLLNIKPLLTVNDEGEVDVLGTSRSLDGGVRMMVEKAKSFLEKAGFAGNFLAFGAYTVEEMKIYALRALEGLGVKPSERLVTNIGAVISAHVGPEAFAVVVGRK